MTAQGHTMVTIAIPKDAQDPQALVAAVDAFLQRAEHLSGSERLAEATEIQQAYGLGTEFRDLLDLAVDVELVQARLKQQIAALALPRPMSAATPEAPATSSSDELARGFAARAKRRVNAGEVSGTDTDVAGLVRKAGASSNGHLHHRIHNEYLKIWRARIEKEGLTLEVMRSWIQASSNFAGLWTTADNGWRNAGAKALVEIWLKDDAVWFDPLDLAQRAIYEQWKREHAGTATAPKTPFVALMRRSLNSVRAPTELEFYRDAGLAGVRWPAFTGAVTSECLVLLNEEAVKALTIDGKLINMTVP